MNKEQGINYGELYDSRHPDDEIGDALATFFNPELKNPDYIQQQKENKKQRRNTFIRLAEAASSFVSPVKATSEEQQKNNQNLQIAIAESLANQVNSDDEIDRIAGIFESNDIPNFAKQYLSFTIIHPDIKKEFLEKNGDYRTFYTRDDVVDSLSFGGVDKDSLQSIKSPTLQFLLKNDDTERVKNGNRTIPKYQSLIYADLLKCEIGSGGDSIKYFVQKIRRGEDLMRCIVNGDLDEDELSSDNKKLLTSLLGQLNSLYAQIDKDNEEKDLSQADLKTKIVDMLNKIRPTSRYDLSDRIVRIFFYSNGIKNANQLLQVSEGAKRYANSKNKKAEERLSLKNNDLVKVLDINYLDTTIENGILAKEYLGVGQKSDYTPLDVDFYGYLATDSNDDNLENGIYRTIDNSVNEYMSLTENNSCFLIVKKDARFEETKNGDRGQSTDKYELFRQGIFFEEWLNFEYPDDAPDPNETDKFEDEYYEDEYNPYTSGHRDYGIRTGLPSSEIDAIVIPDENNKHRIIKIVQNNSFYIPIYNIKGELIYSFEQYNNEHRL